MGAIVLSRSVRVGGYDLDEAIAAYLRGSHVMAIGSQSAEAIKLAIGSAAPLASELTTTVRGRDLLSGLPRELELDSEEIRAALESPLLGDHGRDPRHARGDAARARRRHRRATASCWPAAARCCAASPSASRPRPRCRALPGRVAADLRGGRRRAGARGARGALARVVAAPPLEATAKGYPCGAMRLRPLLAVLAVLALAPAAHAAQPPIGHVFVIVLENEDATQTFGAELAGAVPRADAARAGRASCPATTASAHASASTTTSRWSAARRRTRTQADCQIFIDFVPGRPATDGQALGQGCVYPPTVKTVADQLERQGPDAGRATWRTWATTRSRDETACAHPAIGRQDDTQQATRRRPVRHAPQPVRLLPLDHRRRRALRSARRAARRAWPPTSRRPRRRRNLRFITPDLCHDGHDAAVRRRRPGRPASSADAFLRSGCRRSRARRPSQRRPARRHLRRGRGERRRAPAAASARARTRPRPAVQSRARAAAASARSLLSPFIRPGTTSRPAVQPLLAAAQRRGPLRAAAPRLRRAPGLRASAPTCSPATGARAQPASSGDGGIRVWPLIPSTSIATSSSKHHTTPRRARASG